MKKVFLALATICLLGIGVGGVLQAEPIAGNGYDDLYYSDSTYTTVVGERYQDCSEGREGWGATSHYVTTDSWDCETGGSTNGSCTDFYCSGGQVYPWEIYTGCTCIG